MNSDNNTTLQRYAELMIEKIKQVNADDWKKPWFTPQFKGFPQNLSGRAYNNFNKALLYFVCDKYKYQTPVFTTFNQAKNENIFILKGSRSFPVMFYDLKIVDKVTGQSITRDNYNNLSKLEQKRYNVIPIQKYYNVFNLDQTNFCDKYPEKWANLKKQFSIDSTLSNDNYKNHLLDKAIENKTWICPIELKMQSEAFYSPSEDLIILPKKEQFYKGKEFYYTVLHEMAHSTGHPERLKRQGGMFGSPQYAKEELIAELSSAVAGRDMGMDVFPREENAQYLKDWLTGITNDPKYIMGILNDVNKAVTMIEEGIGVDKENVSEKQGIVISCFSEDEYLALKGYGSPFYSEPAMHKGKQKTAHQQEQLLNINLQRSNKYVSERNALKEEYRKKIASGELRQPTRVERIIKAANGHPDLESTQAARRLALTHGISWRSEKNNLPAIYQYYYDSNQQLHAKYYQEGTTYDRFVWKNEDKYILCTGSRSGGDYVEHILPPEEINEIQKISSVDFQSSDSIKEQYTTNLDFSESYSKLNVITERFSQLGHTKIVQSLQEHKQPIEDFFKNREIKYSIENIPITSNAGKELTGDIIIQKQDNKKICNIENLSIRDFYTNRIDPLNSGNIDFSMQSQESITQLLSGQKVKMTNKSGTSSLVRLNKTITGWGISAAKQTFNEASSSAEI